MDALPEARVKVPSWTAPHALRSRTKADRSRRPGLRFLPHPIPEDVHRAMQRRRNKNDGEQPEERVPGEEPPVRPRGHEGRAPEGPEHEVVLVEPGRLR